MRRVRLMELTFWELEPLGMTMAQCGAIMQSKYILHCMRENEFINQEGQVVLRKATAPPAVDEKLGEEEGTIKEKNDALTMCRKYIGQMMWLTTCTRPDTAACLGILASLMVRRPQEVKNHLVSLWRYLWCWIAPVPPATLQNFKYLAEQ